jgi:glycosylphosphatidylinositol phospholipase D
MIGAPGTNVSGKLRAGAVYVVYGRSGSPPSVVDFADATLSATEVLGGEAGGGLGASVAVGDLNGDGFADLIAGAPDASPGGKAGAGSVFVIYGRSGSLPQRMDLSTATDGVVRLDGEAAGDGFGRAVAAGNPNGDGFADLLAGAPGADPGGKASAGQAYLYYGGAILSNPVRISGGAAGDALGSSVGAGDLNRDGLDELLLGAPDATPVGGPAAGIVYALAGRPTPLPARLDLGASPAGLSRVMGDRPRDRTGSAIAVGDVNGDGIGDLIVGARLADPPGGFNAGAVYVILGKAGNTISDVDLNGAPPGVTRILGERANDLTGQSVAVGDLNRDGFGDVVLGAPGSFLTDDRESETPGKVFVVSGRAALPPVIDLSAGPTMVSRIVGASAYLPNTGSSDRTGQSVAAGDLNGDGFADLLAGAPGADPAGRVDAGKAYLILAGPRPDLRVASAGLAFGNVVVGQSRHLTVAVTNAGTATLLLNTLTVNTPQFRVQPPGPYALNAGDSLLVAVTFAPSAAGPQAGTLTLTTSNDPAKGFVSLSLSGTGAQPDIDAPPSLAFGRVALGAPAVSTLLISNLGTSDLTVRKITASDSQFVAQPDSILVPAGARLRVTVIFTPKVLGPASATLTLLSDDPDEGTVTVALTGSAASPRAATSASRLSFGSVLIGASFAVKLTVSNLGDADLSVTRLASDNPQFTVFPTAFTVPPGKAQDVTVTFAPTASGPQSGTLTLSANDPVNPALAVTVTGDGGRQPAIALSATQLNFGAVDVGAWRDTTLYVHNRGDGILSVTSVTPSDTQFVARPDSFTVAGKDSVKITVRFSPKSGKDLSAALLMTNNDPTSRSAIVTLSGRGVLRVASAVSVSSLDFGEVEVGTKKTLTLTLHSRGNAPLIIRSITSSDTQFVARPDSLTVAGGDSARIAVTFSPAALSDVSAALTVLTNDFSRGAIPVSLAGSGARPLRLSLDLNPARGDQGATADTVQTRSCSASVALYVANALNLSAFSVTLKIPGQLMFRSFSDVGAGEDNFLRSAGGGLTLSASQTGPNTVRVTGALSNPTLATAPDGGGLLAALQFDTFSPAEGLARGDAALISVEQAVFTRLVNTGPDTLRDTAPARIVFSNLPGDGNADGVVDNEDFFILTAAFGATKGTPDYTPACDLNLDGVIDLTDFFMFSDRMGTRVASCRKLGP